MTPDWNCLHLYIDEYSFVIQSRIMLHGDYALAWNKLKNIINTKNLSSKEIQQTMTELDHDLTRNAQPFDHTIYMEIKRFPGKGYEKLIIADTRPEDKELKSTIILELDDNKLRKYLVHWSHKDMINGIIQENPIRHKIDKVRELFILIKEHLPFVECVDYKDSTTHPKQYKQFK